jgi:hypothetical protein
MSELIENGLVKLMKKMDAIAMKRVIKGNSTNNHEMGVNPDRHKILRTHVQKRTYMILMTKIMMVLETLQL